MLNDNERKRIILFVLTLTISSLGTSIVVSVFPYFILALKIPMKEYGLIGTIASTIIILSRIPFSSIMPVFGYFKTFSIGYSFIMFSRLFYYFAGLGIFSFIFFSIGVIFSRMMFPVYNTVRGTVIAKYFSSERRANIIFFYRTLYRKLYVSRTRYGFFGDIYNFFFDSLNWDYSLVISFIE